MNLRKIVGMTAIVCLSMMCLFGCRGNDDVPSTEGGSGETVGFGQVGADSTKESVKESTTEEPTTEEPVTEEATTEPETEGETEVETEPQLVFQEVNEVVYTTDRLNIRLAPSTDAQILRTMYYGESVVRTGIAEGWSRILYNGQEYYASSAYLSLEPVIADTLSGRVEQLLYGMKVAKETDQLVLAVGKNDGGDRCTVFYYTKNESGIWTKHFEVDGFWGYGGVKKVIYEMDGCTPVGCFPFRFAYGIQEDPGSIMEYKIATPTAYMVDDVNSRYYNQWVDTEDPGVVKDWSSAEHVIDYVQSYDYGLYIDNNPTCDPTQGSSVICIHCPSPRGISPGCINIPKESMIRLVRELDYHSRIVIVYGVEDLAEY
ncbi:MAG: SH3 domain-containing protein [Lachnospiraceae bacterium]|nr:SH3 domain-containing protein [Lachnospiraceae bacterium]